MDKIDALKARRREDYRYMLEYKTRWTDSDKNNNMNNSLYNFLFDSIVNDYLMTKCNLHPSTSQLHPLAILLHTKFFASIAYPSVAELALRVNRLGPGPSTVTYEIALFERGVEQVRAVGEFVHVFVERETGEAPALGMNESLRKGLEGIWVDGGEVRSKL